VITAQLLAAGSAHRFGAPKLVQELAGRAIIRWVADALLASRVDRLQVVVPPEHGDIVEALAGTKASFVVNPYPEHGIGASIAAGVSALGERTDAVLIALADEPGLDAAVVASVLEAFRRSQATAAPCAIVAPTYRGTPGHPVLFDRGVFAELRALDGDRGARSVIEREPSRVAIVQVDAPPPGDVDTPEDLARLRRARQNMSGHSPFPTRDR